MILYQLFWTECYSGNEVQTKAQSGLKPRAFSSLVCLITSDCRQVIRRDIARTYPEHEFFKEKDGLGQESLFNVMKAYSLHDREVGYCQGSGFIVGLLLMHVSDTLQIRIF